MDTYGGSARTAARFGQGLHKSRSSAAYFAAISKHMVAGLADGGNSGCVRDQRPDPLSVFVDSFGTGKFTGDKLAEIIKKKFDLRPYAIIRALA
ncbi:MAG: methionine adenosyltransferase domain-containing protein [Christensenellaceae bacterium]